MHQPIIGITVDNKDNSAASKRYESSIGYSRAVVRAGGVPVLLPHEIELVHKYVALCDGVMFTGGVDPRTEAFGEPTHLKAKPMDAARQAFELALLAALDGTPDTPVMGICLGMQLMALHAGGRLNQHLPDTLGEQAADAHQGDRRHAIFITAENTVLLPRSSPSEIRDPKSDIPPVTSWHHQAVADPGRLRVVAQAPDGVIEAIDDAARRFYLGVQWHPERSGDDRDHVYAGGGGKGGSCGTEGKGGAGGGPLNFELVQRFVSACRDAT